MAEIIRKDPAVTGIVSFVGAGTINTTPNTGRLTIALKPVSQRDPVDVVIARMHAAIAGLPGITAFFQPVQDIQIGTRISRTPYQYTLMDTDAAELATWAPKLRDRLASLPALKDVATDQANNGYRTNITVDRDQAMRLGVTMQAIQDTLYDAFGQRQISTIFGQANQYRVVLEVIAGLADGPGFPQAAPRPRRQRRPGPLVRRRQDRPHHGTAGHRAPGTIPRGDPELRPSTWLFAERRSHQPSPRPNGRSGCRKRSSATIPATQRSSSRP